MCPCIPDRIGIWKCWFLRRGKNRSTWRKTSQSKWENQQQTQPTYGIDTRIQTWATLVGGVLSPLCHPYWQTFLHLSTGTQKYCTFCPKRQVYSYNIICSWFLSWWLEKYCHLLLPSFYLTNFFFFLAESHWFIPTTLSSGKLSSWLLSGDFCWTCFSHSLAVLGVPTTAGLTGVGVGVEISAEKDSWGIL